MYIKLAGGREPSMFRMFVIGISRASYDQETLAMRGYWGFKTLYIKYTMNNTQPPITKDSHVRYMLPADKALPFHISFPLEDNPEEFIELEYGFSYTVVARPIQGFLNHTIHPKGR